MFDDGGWLIVTAQVFGCWSTDWTDSDIIWRRSNDNELYRSSFVNSGFCVRLQQESGISLLTCISSSQPSRIK